MKALVVALSLLITLLLGFTCAYAGDDRIDLDAERYLKVNSKLSNGYRFDLIEPKDFYAPRTDGTTVEATNYNDSRLIVTKDGGKELVFTESVSYQPSFDNNEVLSTDYVLLRSMTGGGSCCDEVAVYRTNPTFKKIYEKVLPAAKAEVVGPHKINVMKSSIWNTAAIPRSKYRYDDKIIDLKGLR
jgi:hypothetical protein